MIDIEIFNILKLGIFSNPIFHPYNLQLYELQLFINSLKGVATAYATVTPFAFLNNLDENEQIKPFRLATLGDCGGDISKRWYINFWVWDGLKNKMIRKRLYEINKFKTAAERYAFAERYIKGLNERLKAGMHINNLNTLKNSEVVAELKNYNVFNGLEYVVEIIRATKRHATYLSYKSDVKIFKAFLKKEKLNTLYINQLQTKHFYLFVDYLTINKKVGNVTVNNKIATLKSIFNKLVERGLIDKNPVNVKKLKEQLSSKNLAFNQAQIKTLKTTIKTKEPYLWLFVQFIYYTYMRPTEIMRLKIENIDIKKEVINIAADSSKNHKNAKINIPKPLINELKKIKINNYNKSHFVFTANKTPGPKQISKNYMSLRHQKIINELRYKTEYTLYSWKHTGVVNAYKSGIDIKSIQLQCRHSSIEQTDRYLKSLGFGSNSEILKIPEL